MRRKLQRPHRGVDRLAGRCRHGWTDHRTLHRTRRDCGVPGRRRDLRQARPHRMRRPRRPRRARRPVRRRPPRRPGESDRRTRRVRVLARAGAAACARNDRSRRRGAVPPVRRDGAGADAQRRHFERHRRGDDGRWLGRPARRGMARACAVARPSAVVRFSRAVHHGYRLSRAAALQGSAAAKPQADRGDVLADDGGRVAARVRATPRTGIRALDARRVRSDRTCRRRAVRRQHVQPVLEGAQPPRAVRRLRLRRRRLVRGGDGDERLSRGRCRDRRRPRAQPRGRCGAAARHGLRVRPAVRARRVAARAAVLPGAAAATRAPARRITRGAARRAAGARRGGVGAAVRQLRLDRRPQLRIDVRTGDRGRRRGDRAPRLGVAVAQGSAGRSAARVPGDGTHGIRVAARRRRARRLLASARARRRLHAVLRRRRDPPRFPARLRHADDHGDGVPYRAGVRRPPAALALRRARIVRARRVRGRAARAARRPDGCTLEARFQISDGRRLRAVRGRRRLRGGDHAGDVRQARLGRCSARRCRRSHYAATAGGT